MDTSSNSATSAGARKKRWATKTKTGCDTCRIRRIKCDERKPQCQRCELGRRTCTGVFYGKRSGNVSDSSASSPPSMGGASRSASPPPRVAAMIVRKHGIPKSPNNPPQFVGTLDVRDLIDLAPSLATATHTVEASANWYEFIRARVRELTSYIFYLPSRSGHDNALDSAIRCTASGFREFAQSGSDSLSLFRTRDKSVALYTSALRELQTALQDPNRSTSAEVLCATELLCIFECLSSVDPDGTVQHAKGAYRLIQNRGASRFDSEFDKSLFMNQLPLLAVQSFHLDQICFLDQPHWQALIKASVPTTTGMDPLDDYMLTFYLSSINITNTFIKITAMVLGSVPEAQVESFRQSVMLELEEETMDLQRWKLQLLRGRPPYPQDDSDDDSFSKWQDLYDAYQCTTLLFQRMYVAVGAEQAELFEQQAQILALNLLNIARARPQSSIRRPNTLFVEPTCLAVINSAKPWAEYATHCTAQIAIGQPTMIVPPKPYRLWASLLGIQLRNHPTPNNGTGY